VAAVEREIKRRLPALNVDSLFLETSAISG